MYPRNIRAPVNVQQLREEQHCCSKVHKRSVIKAWEGPTEVPIQLMVGNLPDASSKALDVRATQWC